jgi:hypothetical protein
LIFAVSKRKLSSTILATPFDECAPGGLSIGTYAASLWRGIKVISRPGQASFRAQLAEVKPGNVEGREVTGAGYALFPDQSNGLVLE